jgi:hypothetical protein
MLPSCVIPNAAMVVPGSVVNITRPACAKRELELG